MKVGRLSFPDGALREFCGRWKVTELALFGSALRDDFSADSDIDLLVTFGSDSDWSLLDYVTMQDELGALLGRKVDLVTRRSIEASENPIRRRNILESARVFYPA